MAYLGQQYSYYLADSITPFIFITATRLVIANVIIALIESLILRFFFKVRRRRLFGLMILANYFSAIVGGFLLVTLGGLLSDAFNPIIFHLIGFLVSMFLLAFVLSFALEFPFVLAAARPQAYDRWWSLLACAAAQMGSYAVLFPLYWFTAYTIMQYNADIIPTKSLDFVKRKNATIIFLSPNGTSVLQTQLNSSPAHVLLTLESPNLQNLTINKADNADRWDLWLTSQWNYVVSNQDIPDAKLLARGIALRFPHEDSDENNYIDWRLPAERDWKVDASSNGFMPVAGLKARNEQTGQEFQIKLITAFASWAERCPNILPGDQVVFEISGEIVVLDMNTRKLGFIAYGHSPIVISPGTQDAAVIAQSESPLVETVLSQINP